MLETKLTTHEDDRGWLYEVIHSHDIPQFGQVYIVGDWKAGTIRAFHRHFEMWDWFCIVKGSAKFILVDENKSITTHVLTANNPKVLHVPPTVWHGWMALEDGTTLLSIASHCYNKEKPDEERVHYSAFGVDLWDIKFK